MVFVTFFRLLWAVLSCSEAALRLLWAALLSQLLRATQGYSRLLLATEVDVISFPSYSRAAPSCSQATPSYSELLQPAELTWAALSCSRLLWAVWAAPLSNYSESYSEILEATPLATGWYNIFSDWLLEATPSFSRLLRAYSELLWAGELLWAAPELLPCLASQSYSRGYSELLLALGWCIMGLLPFPQSFSQELLRAVLGCSEAVLRAAPPDLSET
jgi:hypothetical protein